MSSGLILIPINRFTWVNLTGTLKSFILFGYWSIISDEILPPAISLIKSAALFKAVTVRLGSVPLSNLKDASVLSP